ncbi:MULTISPECIES: flagellar biosynthesis protein FlhB [unclassified Shewanella]|uniref:flagellar biosynthesis protein FlhB n=1 Tax=unclassified Shewanella TaxID=196818 RepID=UPI000C854689|nr:MULTISPECIES: flagellar biosynthesis protein FlhB [unclassified Shewanella]MDO6641120.1 flagellar biosynthesis protein FlhB [Shewanella sp. 5_MG-2023]PMG32018.1 flagellar biosynthesis protein FlhB [Shewanella sp. 10N.286.52.C2]PMG49900.1 flagellar biosynthesis protein FlhB [Shewanella sp. 10N.286.52.B9]PMH85975.1 flagellar biosynthesis protein FlhB [Shewanella sp. 10N.286.48.B5]PMI01248.1 flagellar biosynthesis protein FlhB [Shewanella sp. 10N.286.48.A6]
MAEDTGQERTEDPTAKRLEQSREKGQVARSKELGTAAVLLASAVGFAFVGQDLARSLHSVMTQMLTMERDQIYDTNSMFLVWGVIGAELAWPLFSFIAFLAFIAFLGNIVLGGITFSVKAFMPKGSKMNPAKGFKRMFGTQALVELTKGIAKFLVVAISAYFLLSFYFYDILTLSMGHLPGNIYHALDLLVWMFILLCSSMLLIVVIDVPFQIWNHNKQLKMTKQEVKDEYKDSEGKPEVKGRIRQLQHEMANKRMMSEVPNADVIVVNPEHYAVAVKYDASRSSAPFLVAKGVDDVAFKIREIAREHEVPIVSAPPLARAIYHTTKIDQQVPEGLFTAIAQILAYVFQLKQYQKGRGKRPKPIPLNQPIPDDLKH